MAGLLLAMLAGVTSGLQSRRELALEKLALRQQLAVLSRRTMANENVGWGAPRIHGELLKPGFTVSQATVSRCMPRRAEPPSQTWRTFLANHMHCAAAIDFFVVGAVRDRRPQERFARVPACAALGTRNGSA